MVKVLQRFADKTDNKKIYNKGDSYTHEDAERVAFLIKKGFLQKSKPKKKVDKNG